MKNIIPASIALIAAAGPAMAHHDELGPHAVQAALIAAVVFTTGYLVRRGYRLLKSDTVSAKEVQGQ